MSRHFSTLLCLGLFVGQVQAQTAPPVQQVALELRVLRLSAETMAKLGHTACPAGILSEVFDGAGSSRFLDDVRLDPKSSVIQSQKVTVFEGQEVNISAEDARCFITCFDVKEVNGRKTYISKNKPLASGTNWHIRPTVLDDRRVVQLVIEAQAKKPVLPVPVVPVTLLLTPIYEGTVPQPFPFIQYVHQPEFDTASTTQTFQIGDGSTVLMDGWIHKKVENVRPEHGHVLLLITPHIVNSGVPASPF
jgi:hypothetical protein